MIKSLLARSLYFLMVNKFYLSLVMKICEFSELSKYYIADKK